MRQRRVTPDTVHRILFNGDGNDIQSDTSFSISPSRLGDNICCSYRSLIYTVESRCALYRIPRETADGATVSQL